MCNYRIIFILILLGGFFLPFFVLAQERIDNYDVTININSDSSLDISERIDYNFSQSQKHGIYRTIPIKYKARSGNYNLRISNISVVDENSVPYTFKKSISGGEIKIKIGDEDKLVIGEKIYIINYTIKRAINYFDSYDELYWNAIGTDWSVEIDGASAQVILPQKVDQEQLQAKCFFGSYGSTTLCETEIDNQGDKTVVYFKHPYRLPKGQGITIVLGIPKGVIIEPGFLQKALDTVRDNGILVLPILVFIILFRRWYKYGRDPRGRSTIYAQYSAPDNLTPLEVGTIIDERFDNRDLSAEIINLAIKGYLRIERIVKKKFIIKTEDYFLTKLKQGKNLKNKFDRKLMESLFKDKDNVKMSKLRNEFYKDLNDIKKETYQAVVKKGYFPKNPNKVRNIYIGIGIGFVLIGPLAAILWGVIGIVSVVVSMIIIIVFAFFMPRKTKKGVITKENVLGLKEYLSVAEKDRIKFHNAPKKNPKHFEKLLPFAMVLGVEKEWAKQFEEIYIKSPNWYRDSGIKHFNSFVFVNSLGDFSKTANAALISSPSRAASGGSGFGGGGVGGGFGGGGGGSW